MKVSRPKNLLILLRCWFIFLDSKSVLYFKEKILGTFFFRPSAQEVLRSQANPVCVSLMV